MTYKTVVLSDDEYQRCANFSKASALTQQDIEFGERQTAPRNVDEIARDNMIGKMAEIAVAKMLNEYGIDADVNFDIYGRGEWDDDDFYIKGWRVDVKSTRSGQWLLFELNKMKMRDRQGLLPDALFMCKTEWDRNTDTPKRSVELIGAISLFTLIRNGKRIRKGQCIPNTSCKLQADNFAVHFDDLNHDWRRIITEYMNSNPPYEYILPHSF